MFITSLCNYVKRKWTLKMLKVRLRRRPPKSLPKDPTEEWMETTIQGEFFRVLLRPSSLRARFLQSPVRACAQFLELLLHWTLPDLFENVGWRGNCTQSWSQLRHVGLALWEQSSIHPGACQSVHYLNSEQKDNTRFSNGIKNIVWLKHFVS